MAIIELFVKTYKLLQNNLILMFPLLLFLLILRLISSLMIMGGVSPIIIFPIMGLFCAFGAGWFNMFHKSLEFSHSQVLVGEEKVINRVNLFKEFFPGVEKYFLKIIFGNILYFALIIILNNILDFFEDKFIGIPRIVNQIKDLGSSVDYSKFLMLLNSASEADKSILVIRSFLFLLLLVIFSYLTMFWVQAIISENKNIFSAYFESLKMIIKKPFTTIIIFIAYLGSLIIISILYSKFLNYFTQMLGLFLFLLTIVYFTMMNFLYFEKYRKTNSVSRTDSVG